MLQYLILKRSRVEEEVNKEAQEIQAPTDSETPAAGHTQMLDPAVGKSWELITNYWQLDEPKMIISVTGGARRFYMKQRLLKSFKRGLMKAATAAGQTQ